MVRNSSRRNLMKTLGASALGLSAIGTVSASDGYPRDEFEEDVSGKLEDDDIYGVNIGIKKKSGEKETHAFGKDVPDISVEDDHNSEDLTTDHRLRVASVTKTLTSCAIIRLVENEVIDWDDKVFSESSVKPDGLLPFIRYANPGGSANKPIRIKDLINHNIYHDCSCPRPVYTSKARDGSGYNTSLPGSIRNLNASSIVFKSSRNNNVGEGKYTNYAYAVLGAVIGEVTGSPVSPQDVKDSYVSYIKTMLEEANVSGEYGPCGVEKGEGPPNEGWHHELSPNRDPYDESLIRHRAYPFAGWAFTPGELVDFGHAATRGSVQDSDVYDTYMLMAAGWEVEVKDHRFMRDRIYYGHEGAQSGVLAALWTNSLQTISVQMNTRDSRNYQEPDGGTREWLVRYASKRAEHM